MIPVVATTPAAAKPSIAVASLPSGAPRCYEAFARFRYVDNPRTTLTHAILDAGGKG